LAVQESGGQLEVVSGRPHRHRYRRPVQPDLERQLDRDLVAAAVDRDLLEHYLPTIAGWAARGWRSGWPTGSIATATTLYSGHEVLTSDDWPISRFVRTSGKWKAVNTWPGSMRCVTWIGSSISPRRLRTLTVSPSLRPSSVASSGCTSSQSLLISCRLPVRRVIV